MSFLLRTTTRLAPRQIRQYTTTRILSAKVDASFISQITAAEKKLTNSDEPVRRGPTAKAQQHVGQELTAQVVHDITEGEKAITNSDEPVQGGPTSVAQSLLTASNSPSTSNASRSNSSGDRVLDAAAMRNIASAEAKITGQDTPVQGGPAATAQQHSGEPISSSVIREINIAEANLTGEDKVKGGPTATTMKMSNTPAGRGTPTSTSTSSSSSTSTSSTQQHTGHLDSSTLSRITDAEKRLTGEDGPVQGGPAARAQQHANQPISSQTPHDITEGEKVITGGERVKGGPTSKAQSELGKSRN